MIEALPNWAQAFLFIGLIIIGLRLLFQFGKWLVKAITDEGMM